MENYSFDTSLSQLHNCNCQPPKIMSRPILLILGAGGNVGLQTASFFATKGFHVAIVARSLIAKDYPSYLTINADLSDPNAIETVFEKVRKELGDPNVVVYNGKSILGLRIPSGLQIADIRLSIHLSKTRQTFAGHTN